MVFFIDLVRFSKYPTAFFTLHTAKSKIIIIHKERISISRIKNRPNKFGLKTKK